MHENIAKFFSFKNSIAFEIFENCQYPYEALSKIGNYITIISKALDKSIFESIATGIYVAKSAKVADSAKIIGPCIIDENAEIRHCAFIRGNVIIGKNAVVGNSTEIKNSILFDNVQVPHYNYIGDSVLGYRSHMGAASITSNVKMDKEPVFTDYGNGRFCSGLKKLGAIIGDHVEIGCGAVLNPGCVIGKNSNVYPLSSVRGYLKDNSIYKSENDIIIKE